MFYSDQPINTKDSDCLKRTKFSEQLAKAILSYTKIDNFVIALCGEWGSGKTSILNMVIEEIGNFSNDINEDEKPIIVKFNPWNYSDCSQLISQFFVVLREQLKIDGRNKNLKAVGEALESYSSLLEYSVYIPFIGEYLVPLKSVFINAGKHIKRNIEDGNSVEATKAKVIEALKKQKHKFIIIIDDIDRLNNAQIRSIFQLVNSLAGFPNMVYVLAFDREVVTRALQEEQKCDGEEYLEKIIQVLFEVPEVSKKLLNEVFINRISDIIFGEEVDNTSFDNQYWPTIYENCIFPFVESIRDVNRIINAFEFKYGLMHDETNVIDLLAITTLYICAPTIHSWIYDNANSLVGSIETAGGITGEQQTENRDKYLNMFKDIYPTNPNRMMNIIRSLFPKFAWKTGGYSRNRESNEELRYNDRIASEARIKRYFNLSLEEITIGKKQIRNTIFHFSKEELEIYFKYLLEHDILVDYLNELLIYVKEIPQSKKTVFIDTLLEIQTLETAYNRKSVFATIPATKCYYVMVEVFKSNQIEENTYILSKLIEKSNGVRLSIICKVVEGVVEAYGRKGNYINSSLQFVEESDLEEIEQLLLCRIKKLSEKENFFDYKEEVEYIYRMWRYLEKETFDLYMKKILCIPINVPKYLNTCSGTWSSSKTRGWTFKDESFGEYIGKEDAYQKIVSLKNTKEFSVLNHSFKEVAVAFYLWCNNKDDDYHNISKERVDAIVSEWEKEK